MLPSQSSGSQAWKRAESTRRASRRGRGKRGEESFIGDTSPLVFAITGGHNASYCDPASVIISVKRVVLKNGGTYIIRASLRDVRDDMDILNVMNDLRLLQQRRQRGDGERNRKDKGNRHWQLQGLCDGQQRRQGQPGGQGKVRNLFSPPGGAYKA